MSQNMAKYPRVIETYHASLTAIFLKSFCAKDYFYRSSDLKRIVKQHMKLKKIKMFYQMRINNFPYYQAVTRNLFDCTVIIKNIVC